MRFSPSFLDEIRARLPVSDVVRRRMKLVKAGREWRGLSPFNQEKTPSFYVNDQKGFFHDFSSGKHGNIFDFLMEAEGLSFPEAVERLAGEAGLALPTVSPESARREEKRASLQEVLEWTAAYFEKELQGGAGARARAYLEERGISLALQQQFRLGYSRADRHALRDWLAGKGASVDLMIEAGLLVHGEDIIVPYDRFRDRLMFPIADRSGRVIAFGGRALDKSVSAKYLNSPETPLFHKGGVLFNHHAARRAAQESGTLIAVEGYIDVIALTGAGFAHVVAPLGTALTPDQCELLWSMAEEPILCFDGDKAGRRASERAMDTALPLIAAGRSLRFAFLPDGLDPDDFVRSHGPGAVSEILAAAKPLVDALWTREVEAAPLGTPERRAALEQRITVKLQEIRDDTLRRYYREDMGERLRALRAPARFSPGQEARGRAQARGGERGFRAPAPARGFVGSAPTIGASLLRSSTFGARGTPAREAGILVVLLNHPALLFRHAEEIASLDLSTRDLTRLRDALMQVAHEEAGPLSYSALRTALAAAGLEAVRAQVESAAPLSAAWCAKPGAAESDADEALRQALALHRRARALHRELQAAVVALGQDDTDSKFARLCEIQAELAGLDGREAVVEGFGASSGRQSGI
jgi:DNA primase